MVIALVGNPNCGKSVIFNALTHPISTWALAGVTVDIAQEWRGRVI